MRPVQPSPSRIWFAFGPFLFGDHMDRQRLDKIIDLATSKLAPDGYRCIEAEWDGGEKILRLYVDRQNAESETIITIDECVAASHLLNEVPEIDQAVSTGFYLEVSSPGIERPIRLADDFRRMIGTKVQVKLSKKVDERKNAVGVVKDVAPEMVDANGTKVTLVTDSGDWSFAITDLKKANLVFDWNSRA
jgi:ribosome maturation factor RimP